MIDDEMILVAAELLEEFGFEAEVKRAGTPVLNTTTLEVSSTLAVFNCRAIYIDPSNSKLSGYETTLAEDNQTSRKWMLLQGDQPVQTGDVIHRDGAELTVVSATSVGPTKTVYQRVATEETKVGT